jgi:hypothetical protein
MFFAQRQDRPWAGFVVLTLVVMAGFASFPASAERTNLFVEGPWFQATANGAFQLTGNFNSDLDPDLAICDRWGNQVHVWLGNGDGSFSFSATVAVPGQPVSGSVMDINGDGKDDVALCLEAPANAIQLLIGDGNGGLVPWQNFATTAVPNTVAGTDWDGDGDTDLAVAVTRVDDARCVLYENSSGSFIERHNIVMCDRTSTKNLVFADFDLDGDTDVAMACTNGRCVRIVFNDGDWSVHLGDPWYPPTLYALNGIEGGDLDGDGDMDLISCNNNSHGYAVFLNNGDGTFVVQDWIMPGWSMTAVSALGDYDRDCVLDVAITDYDMNYVYILHGVGDGTFEHPPMAAYPMTGAAVPEVADLNRDGIWDLSIGCTDGSVRTLLGSPAEFFVIGPEVTASDEGINMTVGLINGDSHADFIALDRYHSQMQVWLGNGQAGFARSNLLTLVGQPVSAELLQVDADGFMDLAVCLEGPANVVQILCGDGFGNFCPGQRINTMPVPNSVTSGDLDGDGDADLAVGLTRVGDARCMLYENVGGAFVERGNYIMCDRVSTKNVVLADFDNDGDLDIAVACTDGRCVCMLLNQGNWVFQPGQCFYPPTLIALNGIDAGDFDEDGDIDLISCNNNSHGYAVFLNNGDATFTVTDMIVPDWSLPAHGTVMDVDWDCHLDVVVPDYGTNEVYVLHGLGDGTFDVLSISYPIPHAAIGYAADFDEDDVQDVIFACSDGVARMLLGNLNAWMSGVASPDPKDVQVEVSGLTVIPNPGGSQRQFSYALADESPVQLRIVDVSGRLITTVVDAWQEAGDHQMSWDGRDNEGRLVSSGVYFAVLRTGEGVQRRTFRLNR